MLVACVSIRPHYTSHTMHNPDCSITQTLCWENAWATFVCGLLLQPEVGWPFQNLCSCRLTKFQEKTGSPSP
jgi:hypothetical protein